eukprot:CAMPEP_0185556254 /NCGR_PEP_ID=MMETSP1381-20130426/46699_1 /TAXON_ID=298111 /ORGANISM="Pavlova sp., Strain CCMP459" /LENGTH=48 /DNA_ID= /DNA_START= /DNA_END= /DNA_ORIENTATION=
MPWTMRGCCGRSEVFNGCTSGSYTREVAGRAQEPGAWNPGRSMANAMP